MYGDELTMMNAAKQRGKLEVGIWKNLGSTAGFIYLVTAGRSAPGAGGQRAQGSSPLFLGVLLYLLVHVNMGGVMGV
jgi:hypothetical protein